MDARAKPRALSRLKSALLYPRVPRFAAVWRYLVAPSATLVCALAQLAFFPHPGLAPFVLFYVAVVAAAWLGGRGPGLLAVALSAAIGNYLFIAPEETWSTSGPAFVATAMFTAGASLVAVLCAGFRESNLAAERTAEALRRQSEMIALSHDAIFTWTFAGSIESWSVGAEEMYGFSRAEALGRSVHALLRTVFPQPLPTIEATLRAAERWEGEVTHTTKDGRALTVSTRLQVVAGAGPVRVLQTDRDITPQKDAQAALQESEARFRVAQQAARIGTFEWNLRTGVNTWSPELEAMYGLPVGGFAGTQPDWETLLHPDDRAAAVGRIRETLATGLPVEGEWRVVWPDGSTHWLAGRFQAFRDAEGRPERVAGVNIDITERKHGEEQLRAARERTEWLARFPKENPDPVVRLSSELEVIYANDAAVELLGDWPLHVGARAPPELAGPSAKALAEDRRVQIELRAGPRAFSTTFMPVHGDVNVYAQDISARRRAESRLRALYDSSLFGVVYWTAAGRITDANDKFLDMIGYTRADLDAGRIDWREVTPPEWAHLDAVSVKAVLANGVGPTFEKEYIRKDGRRLPVLVGGAMLGDARDEGVAFVVDITERKRAEDALREANRRKDEFLAVLSHELRNPLAPIRNSLHVLDHTAPGSAQARRAQAVIERQVDHMTRLVSDLLDVSRISRGKVQLQRAVLDLRAVVEHALDDHRAMFAARGIELRQELPSGPLWANGDATRIDQVLGNLLHNAAKFTNEGGWVFVGLYPHERGPVVRVRDNGVGLAPEMLTRLFQPFSQADQTLDRSAGGLGLGLSLVKALVELHGGLVCAHSDGIGLGAEFAFQLPTASGLLVQPPTLVTAPQAPAPARRVLVIEDNIDAAETLKEILELDRHDVRVAFTGPEGLTTARSFVPELVLCDIGLPGMDGYDVARAFRAEAALRDVPLVALTGYALAEDQRRALAAGFDGHLPKPADLEVLKRMLAEPPRRARTA